MNKMKEETLYIYHTNDNHSHLRVWPRIAKYLREVRRHHEAQAENIFSFDIGDAMDRSNAFAEATDGKGIVRLLKQANYDAVTIGNNEGIGNTKEQLSHLYDSANFNIIVSNLVDKSTNHFPSWAKEISIYHTKEGRAIGVIGLTIPLEMSYGPLGWQVLDPFKTIERVMNKYRDQVSSFFVLSHLGLHYDREIAEAFPVDLILGAHTHHTLPKGEWKAGTLIGAAGRYGDYVGQIKLTYNEGGLHAGQARLLDSRRDLPLYSKEESSGDRYMRIGHRMLKREVVANIPQTLEISWHGTSKLSEAGLDAICDIAHVDLGILNAGLFLIPLLQGEVSKDDLHRCLPHPIRVLKTTMKGKHLKKLLLNMEDQRNDLRSLKLKGIGFRGKVFGEICYRHIEVVKETEEILIKGKPLEENTLYQFATVDYFWFAPFFKEFDLYGKNEILFPHFLRTILGNYLSKIYSS